MGEFSVLSLGLTVEILISLRFGTPSPSIYWNHRVRGKSRKSLCGSIFCGQNLENRRVRNALTLDIFSCLIAKFFSSAQLGDADMAWSAQNLERLGLTFNILWNKGLTMLPRIGFPVLGMDGSYCLWLSTIHAF